MDRTIKRMPTLGRMPSKNIMRKGNTNKNIILNNLYYNNINAIIIGQRNFETRAKCPTSQSTCYSMWGYPWTIFRYD